MFGFGSSDSTDTLDWKKLAFGAAGGLVGTLAMGYYWKGATALHGKDPRKETRPSQDDIEPIEVLESHGAEGSGGSDRPGRTRYPAMGGGGSTGGGMRTAGTTSYAGPPTPITEPGGETSTKRQQKAKTRRRKDALPILRPKARYRRDEGSTEALARIIYQKVRGHEPTDATKKQIASAIHWGYGADNGAVYGALRAGKHTPDIAGGIAIGAFMWLVGDEFAVPATGLSAGPQKYPLKQHIHRLGAHLTYGVTTAAVTQTLWNVFGD